MEPIWSPALLTTWTVNSRRASFPYGLPPPQASPTPHLHHPHGFARITPTSPPSPPRWFRALGWESYLDLRFPTCNIGGFGSFDRNGGALPAGQACQISHLRGGLHRTGAHLLPLLALTLAQEGRGFHALPRGLGDAPGVNVSWSLIDPQSWAWERGGVPKGARTCALRAWRA